GIDEVMTGAGALIRAGIPPIWGPGRHGAGDNVFAYFLDPDRFVVEYTCEIAQVIDEQAWRPKRWSNDPSDDWGIGKQFGPEVRLAMHGEPDPALSPA